MIPLVTGKATYDILFVCLIKWVGRQCNRCQTNSWWAVLVTAAGLDRQVFAGAALSLYQIHYLN